jgi:hypothetical protein
MLLRGAGARRVAWNGSSPLALDDVSSVHTCGFGDDGDQSGTSSSITQTSVLRGRRHLRQPREIIEK